MTGDDGRLATARWLCSPDAAAALALAAAAQVDRPSDPLGAATALRDAMPDLAADRAAAVLEQAALSALARERYGLAGEWRLTRDGLEQGTRPEVAARRAQRLRAAGARRVLDLTAGLGLDDHAFLAAGLEVIAVERDPVIAELLRHNCPGADVRVGDGVALLPELLPRLGPDDVVFVDPARRDPAGPRDRTTARARSERDPERWSPPWSAVASIPHPRVMAKVAPGFTPPPGWEAEWVSVDRTLVECCAASWPLTSEARTAVILSGGTTTVVAADDRPVDPASSLGAWLGEPDPAVLRAAAVGTLARQEEYAPIDPDSSWLTGDRPSSSPALRSYLVVEELVGSPKQQRRRLAERGARRATVKSRDVDAEPRTVLRSLGLTEGPEHVLVLTRRDGRVVTLLAQPAAARAR